MYECGGPKLMQNVVRNESKQKTNAKCSLINNAKCSPKIMQEEVENELILNFNEKCSIKIMQNVVQI